MEIVDLRWEGWGFGCMNLAEPVGKVIIEFGLRIRHPVLFLCSPLYRISMGQ